MTFPLVWIKSINTLITRYSTVCDNCMVCVGGKSVIVPLKDIAALSVRSCNLDIKVTDIFPLVQMMSLTVCSWESGVVHQFQPIYLAVLYLWT